MNLEFFDNRKNIVMVRVLGISLFMIFNLLVIAGGKDHDELFRKAHDAYKNGDFAEAGQLYMKMLDSGVISADIYYNLGNSYYRQQKFAEAILNYERALRIRPGDANVRYNLNLANGFIKDEIITAKPLFILVWWHKVASLLPSAFWLIVHIILFILSLFFTARFLITRSGKNKLRGFRIAVLIMSVSLLFLAISVQSQYDTKIKKEAVIMSESTVVRSGPGIIANSLGEYHAGTRVKVLKEDVDWFEVKTADGHIGWVSGKDLEII